MGHWKYYFSMSPSLRKTWDIGKQYSQGVNPRGKPTKPGYNEKVQIFSSGPLGKMQVEDCFSLRWTETILPVLAKRMQFDSRLLSLLLLAPSNQPMRELEPLSTNQMLDPLDLGTLKSANHRAETTINQSDAGSAGSLNVNGSGSKPNLSNCQNSLAVHLSD